MEKIEKLSPLALAFLGDAIHTTFVRKKVLNMHKNKLENYHIEAKKFCNAKSQANTLDRIFNSLTDDEKDIVRRARNAKPKHIAKNFDEKTYKKATAYEALIAYLYLINSERLFFALNSSIEEGENL